MFKETYGFDVDVFKFGIPVMIDDNEPTSQRRGLLVVHREEDCDYHYDNKSGAYLVNESSSTMLRLMNAHGDLVKFPIKHFLGDEPRMKINLLKKED